MVALTGSCLLSALGAGRSQHVADTHNIKGDVCGGFTLNVSGHHRWACYTRGTRAPQSNQSPVIRAGDGPRRC